ncbi:MAG: hypothetical protein EA398_08705 [Deltaproteobacteria bacterium]|nr:MAG: hypothetical protein EA398_08705 [Deltaproteobacteria bacterium]
MEASEKKEGGGEQLHRHTFQLQLIKNVDGRVEDPWCDVEHLAPQADARTALMNYLRREFPALKSIPESKEGIFTLEDPLFEPGVMTRRYRVKPR